MTDKGMTYRRAAALFLRSTLDLASYQLESYDIGEQDSDEIINAIHQIVAPFEERLSRIAGDLDFFDVDHRYGKCRWCGKRKCPTLKQREYSETTNCE